MGNKNSRLKKNACCSQRDVLKLQFNSFKAAYARKNKEFLRLQDEYNALRLEHQILQKTQTGESGKHIDKATALFNSLQDQYIDRLDRIKTQQHLLSKQTSILNNKKNTIDNQKKNLDTHTNELNTRRRLMIYDENDNRLSIRIAHILKLTLLVASIILIILLAKRN